MANPFGEEVNDFYLNRIARYIGKAKRQEDRAREAMALRDGNSKEEAKTYLNATKEYYGDYVCTLCMIFNGTGDTLHYASSHDYDGCIGRTPYPVEIKNGQWVSFLHAHETNSPSGSEAALIFRGKQKDGLDRRFTLGWSTFWGSRSNNKAYCEMNEVNNSPCWDNIYDQINNSDYTDKVDRDGMLIQVSTATGDSPVFTAVLSIPYTP